jgi:RNA polymerase sigma factor (sigma-70 family)
VADSNYTKQEQLAVLERVIRDVARAKRLSQDEADDFAQFVHLKLLERNYDVFERFSGRSSLKTFLTVVVSRLRLDWQRSLLGKWRPSAMATRLGPVAMRLDRLIYRDGLSAGQAIAQIESDSSLPRTDLWRLVDRLPEHHPRRFVADTLLDSFASTPFDDPIERYQREQAEATLRRQLRAALKSLSANDRRLIVARYIDGQTIPVVARTLRADPKALYRRCDRVLGQLRRRLERAGVPVAKATDREPAPSRFARQREPAPSRPETAPLVRQRQQ